MSEEADDSQKTEEPTPKKLEESRKKGQVALSRELNSWVMLLAATILVGGFGPGILSKLSLDLKEYIDKAHEFSGSAEGTAEIMQQAAMQTLGTLFMPFLFLIVAAIAGPLMQVGPLFAAEAVKPKLSKVSPLQGMKRLFSKRSLVEFAKGIFKITLIAIVGVILFLPFYEGIDSIMGISMEQAMVLLRELFIRFMIASLMILIVMTVIDVTFTRVEHHQKMRMTKQEIKDEYKQAEGDPHVKAKLRQLRAEKSRQRMMAAVPEADVVVTNPTHFSIALKYDPETMDAPVCAAKGVDQIALNIREVAKEHDIVLYENKPLARVLYDTVDIDEVIPPEHYKAVAEIISFVFKLKGKN